MVFRIQFRRDMTTGPKSRVPFGMLGLFMPQNYRLLSNRFLMTAKTNTTAVTNQIHIMARMLFFAATLRTANFVIPMPFSAPHTLFSGHNGAIYDAAYWHAARKWVTAGGDGVVASWSHAGEGTAELHHNQAFFSVATVGNQLIAGSASGELLIKGSGAPPQRIEAHDGGIFVLAAAAKGAVFSGGGAGQIHHWRHSGGTWKLRDRFIAPDRSKVRTLLPAPNGWLVGTSAGWLGTLMDGRFNRFVDMPATGHYAAVQLPQREAWLVASGDGHLRVIRFTGEVVYSFPAHQGPIYRLVVTGDVIWSASRDKSVKAWRASDLVPVDKLVFKGGGHTRSVNALAAHRTLDGWELVSGGDDRSARKFELNDWGYRATSPPADDRAARASDSPD